MREILTTYLTKKGDPQRAKDTAAKPNDHGKMKLWYPASGCGVIFHDELSEEFMSHYPRTQFVKVADYPYSCNDGRFYLFKKYLEQNPGVDEVWITDLFDVKVNYIPKVEDRKTLYVSNENQNWHDRTSWMKEKYKLFNCRDLLGKLVYNPGVFGGHREVILPLFDAILAEFRRVKVGMKNGNMVAFNRAVHEFKGPIVTGYPLHTHFKSYENDEKAAFQHK